jgi:uncharacterized membrane protein YeaQ/YmgE (transglycosylase-associated protein family)
MDIGSLLAALALGFVAGVIGRAVVPGDAFRSFSGWQSWMISTLLGLIGALVGYWIFTGLFGIGDEDKFDWGGIIGAIIGAIVVVAIGSWLFRKIANATSSEPGDESRSRDNTSAWGTPLTTHAGSMRLHRPS